LHFIRTVRHPSLWEKTTGTGTAFTVLVQAASDPLFLAMSCLLLGILPFVFLRGLTVRLEATIVLVGIPWAGAVVAFHRERHATVVASLFLLLLLGRTLVHASALNETMASWEVVEREVARVIPQEVRRDAPVKVLCGLTDIPNQYDRYWLWNPVCLGGWSVRSKAMREEFGVVDFGKLHLDRRYRQFQYIVLWKIPGYSFEQYDRRILQLPATYHVLRGIVVIEKRKPNP
jgi:hypothetical protein